MAQRSEIIFVTLLIPLILGICTFYPAESPFALPALSLACGILLLCLLAGNLLYARLGVYHIKPATLCTCYLLSFLYGGLICMLSKENLKPDYFAAHKSNYLKIRIDEEPQVKNNIIRFKSKVDQLINDKHPANASGHLLVSIATDSLPSATFSYGDELIIPAAFREVPEPRNPYQFDAKSWLAQQNIYHQVFLKAAQVERISKNTANPVIAYAIEVRRVRVEILKKLIKSPEAFAVASTLILGYRSDLSLETLQAYSKTGTIHALSVSGMHVGIIYIVINLALSSLDRKAYGRLLKLLLIISVIWIYALITGLTPSVLRAVLMLSVLVSSKSLRKTTNSYNILAFSAFCMLIFNPFLLFDLGFQLSYLSVIGLIFLQPKINSWFEVEGKILNSLYSALSLSLAAQFTTFPLAAYYFHQFPIYFLVSNLFLVIPVALMMYLGLLILLFRLYFLGALFEWIINSTNRGLKIIAELPFSTISEIWISKAELLLLTCALISLTFSLIYYRKSMLFAGLGLLLIFTASLMLQTAAHHRQRKLIFFSLPRNYATAFIVGNKAVLLTDLQPLTPAFKFNIQPFLDQAQIKTLTFLQPHQRHRSKKLLISEHHVLFYNHTIFLNDSCFDTKSPKNKQHFNTVVFNGNPGTSVRQLLLKTSPGLLVIDGSNKTYTAGQYEKEANKFKIPVQNLKKLKAYLVNLN
jgi:competence protein ComEC